ncbi:72 kDa type IV collagenase-like [Biomphalaria glabrata]|uniref:72 kDa type IV collagenase-like n=1 Tax=Biomphalaria glabrata TaxID=6526 RepID=A0A9W2YIQ7_BIOGL|nr:72 kDa type IV collagenase-like [Biomphalaria glabrata]XP_055862717.1 72 kDa type IV collagenase-like [Biomphalaria glabrata]XP_055862718.1 72 kDa type IV collagenase-like [Biomphalaria glabrata]
MGIKMWLLPVWFFSLTVSNAVSDQSLDIRLADKYLQSYGYYVAQEEPRAENLMMYNADAHNQNNILANRNTERTKALKKLQKFFGLPQTGDLDDQTIKLMSSPRCGVQDVQTGHRPSGTSRRQKRYFVSYTHEGKPNRWEFTELSWALSKPTGQFSTSEQRAKLAEAFRIWGRVVPIKFREETNSREEADIDIQFGRRRHGPENDPEFDGPLTDRPNVLAHAWPPYYTAKGFSGDVHFDEDDNWSSTNFLSVAVHELGHSMGLGHSEDQSAIMYPLYQKSVDLSSDDLAGIRILYGQGSGFRPVDPRTATKGPVKGRPITARPPYHRTAMTHRPPTFGPVQRSPRPSRTTTPSTSENICTRVDVTAVFLDPEERRNQFIAISGDTVHRMTTDGQVLMSEPLSTVYPEAPLEPDVAFSYLTNVYFIKGSRLWSYHKNQLQTGFPKTLNREALPETPKFALQYTDSSRYPRLLLFSDSKWWLFREAGEAVINPIHEFAHGFPQKVILATQWRDGYIYIVSRDSHVKMEIDSRNIIDKEPVPGMPAWLHELCSGGDRLLPSKFLSVLLVSIGMYYIARLL